MGEAFSLRFGAAWDIHVIMIIGIDCANRQGRVKVPLKRRGRVGHGSTAYHGRLVIHSGVVGPVRHITFCLGV